MITKIVFWTAIVCSVILIIQFILSFFGGDLDSDVDINTDVDISTDVDSSDADAGARAFTFKNFIAFLTMFSWSWLGFYVDKGWSFFWSTILAIIVGMIFVWIFIKILKGINKLADGGKKVNLNEAINQKVTVYLRIPPNKEGTGEITINLNGSRQLPAMTESLDSIPTGAICTVQKIENGILIVE